MIDKAEQRRRAAELSQQLAAQGQQAPKLTYPVKPKPAPAPMKFGCQAAQEAKIKRDAAGKELRVGDTVATTVDGIVSVLQIGKIVRIVGNKVEVEIKMNRAKPGCAPMLHQIMKAPSAVVKIEK